MLQYLVILLDDTSVSYCHADNPLKERCLMPLDVLKKAIVFGMKENLMIQYVFPDYELPETYNDVIDSIDNTKIYRSGNKPITGVKETGDADVEVTDGVPELLSCKNVVLRLSLKDVIGNKNKIADLFRSGARLNICITDVEKFSDNDISTYKLLLEDWNLSLLQIFKEGLSPQVNILTDRLFLDKMRNCDAGVTSITVAPNGRFYICPAFYYDERMKVDNMMNHKKPDFDNSVGDLTIGLEIENQQLLRLDHAPLCRNCDAFQCRRCIWLNRKLTWDCNTPSRQQCVISHLERNASRSLMILLQKSGLFRQNNKIKEIDYLDPFDVRERK